MNRNLQQQCLHVVQLKLMQVRSSGASVGVEEESDLEVLGWFPSCLALWMCSSCKLSVK